MVLKHLRHGTYTLLYAQPLLEELMDVLARPRIRDKYDVTEQDVKAFLALLLLRGEAIRPEWRITVCRDPKDNKFLDVAVAGQADVLVSGDKDLLVLHPFQGIPILSPAEFLRRLEKETLSP